MLKTGLAAAGFALLALDVQAGGPIRRLDGPVRGWVIHHRAYAAGRPLEALAWLGSGRVLVPLLAVAASWLLFGRRDLRTAGCLWAGFGAAALGGHAAPSCASWHVAQATAAWTLLAVVAARSAIPPKARTPVVSGCAVAVVAVAVSHVYPGAHPLTATLGGLLLGIAVSTLAIAVRDRRAGPRLAPLRQVVVHEGDPDDR